MSAFPTNRSIAVVAVLAALMMGSMAARAQTAPRSAPSAPGFPACPDSTTAAAEIDTPCLAIVDFEDSVAPANRQGILRGAGAVMRFGFGVMNAAAAMVPNLDAYWSLALDPAVTRIYPDLPVHAIAPPGSCTPWPDCKGGSTTDPATLETLGAGLLRIGADLVWNNQTGAGVGVAILDTGLDSDHKDLAYNINVDGGANCLGNDAEHECSPGNWEDDAGHGTHVGGIVAALHNNLDVAGVAPDATLYAVKVLDGSGSGYMSNVIAGLQWAAGNSAISVVNMSLGGSGNCATEAPLLQDAIQLAIDAGVTVVVAAGNNREVEITDVIPAGCTGVIAVASTSAEDGKNKCKRLADNIRADTASFFTTDGPGVAVSAPGEAREDNSCAMLQPVGILSLAMGGGTTRMYGTSMAAPHVTGVVALMLEANSSLSPAQIEAAIRDSATRVGDAPLPHPYLSPTYDDGIYEGVIDAPAAVAAAKVMPAPAEP